VTIFIALIAIAVLAAAPAIVGVIVGAAYASDQERALGVEATLQAARDRINAAIAANDYVQPADQALVNQILRDSEARLDTCVRNGVVGAYAYVWETIRQIWRLIQGPEIDKAWPLAVAWGGGFYGAFGAEFGWAEPRPGHVLLLLTAALVFIAARPRREAPPAKKARA